MVINTNKLKIRYPQEIDQSLNKFEYLLIEGRTLSPSCNNVLDACVHETNLDTDGHGSLGVSFVDISMLIFVGLFFF